MAANVQSAGARSPLNDRVASGLFVLLRDSTLFLYITSLFTSHGLDLLVGSERTPSIGTAPAGDIFTQLIVTSLLFIGIAWHVVHRTSISRVLLIAWPLVLPIIWLLLSATWSGMPDISVRRAARLSMEVGAVILFAAAYSGNSIRLMRVLYLSFAFILLLDVALLAFPTVSFSPLGYNGVHPGKNQTGAFCFLAIPLFVLAFFNPRIFPTRLISVAFALLSVVILLISQSKTALALVIVCPFLTLAFVLLGRSRPVTAGVVIAMLILANFLFWTVLTDTGISEFLTATIGDPTFTGRDRIWDYALYRFRQAPLVGHGYGSIWHVGEDLNPVLANFGYTPMAGQAHNGYLDVMAQLGLVGLVLLLMFLAVTIYRLWITTPLIRDSGIALFAIYLTLGIMLYDITESNLLRSGAENWLLFLLVVYTAHMTASGSLARKLRLGAQASDLRAL